MTGTLITSEVGFNAEGKQHGYLRAPYSVHRSAYGWSPVPIATILNGEGTTLVISAGVHGDEYEGQIAVASLVRQIDVADIHGRLIFLPMGNSLTAELRSRASPVDDGNLNRPYPGDPKGKPTEMIVHFHEDVILALADYTVDLHSGGSSLIYPATLMRGPSHSPEEEAGLATLTEAFDLPYAWVFIGGGGRGSTAEVGMGAANRKCVINVMAELGGAGCVTPDVLRRTKRGLRRTLHALGMLPDYVPDAAHGTRALNVRGSIYAYEAGVIEPIKAVGESVAEGETVALIHDPETPGEISDVVLLPHAGIALAMRAMARVRRGDALYQIAADVA